LIFLNEGDIQEEEVDVIVSQTDTKLTVPLKLQKKKQIETELMVLRQTKQLALGDVVYTHAGEVQIHSTKARFRLRILLRAAQ
jgi:Holliday junction resolvase-like predicted endonuclease